jgi:hypothetical protein
MIVTQKPVNTSLAGETDAKHADCRLRFTAMDTKEPETKNHSYFLLSRFPHTSRSFSTRTLDKVELSTYNDEVDNFIHQLKALYEIYSRSYQAAGR